ncbi:MAG: universal stress protein [Dehalococcoidia bacterium]|nr:universal stress protein [Dehalococcoidia bacterium]
MYEKILVPLDGSAAAERCLPYVEEIAARTGSAIFLISVSETGNDDIDDKRSYLESLLDEMESDLEGFPAKDETAVYQDVLTGKTAAEIVRYADENEINLIVMTASGSSGEGPWRLGNIAAKVIRATNRPVLLVRKEPSAGAIEQRNLIKKVLLPLDGSALGESAIPQVEALAKALDFEVVLLHILDPVVTVDMPGLASVTRPTSKQLANEEEKALDYLGKIETALREKGLNVSSQLRSGSAAEEIIALAKENGIDLIAMSTHGRSGISKWVFGSVTDKVLHAGETPVLAVRPAGR